MFFVLVVGLVVVVVNHVDVIAVYDVVVVVDYVVAVVDDVIAVVDDVVVDDDVDVVVVQLPGGVGGVRDPAPERLAGRGLPHHLLHGRT